MQREGACNRKSGLRSLSYVSLLFQMVEMLKQRLKYLISSELLHTMNPFLGLVQLPCLLIVFP